MKLGGGRDNSRKTLDEFNSNSSLRIYNLMDPVNNLLSFEDGDAGRDIMGDLKEREKET